MSSRSLCKYARTGKCSRHASKCRFRHEECKDFTSCPDRDCPLAHSQAPGSFHRAHSHGQSKVTNQRTCRHGMQCFRVTCPYGHPSGWQACKDESKCNDFACTATHPPKRTAKCSEENRCTNSACCLLHPDNRRICTRGNECRIYSCADVHSNTRPRCCSKDQECVNFFCLCLHPPERDSLLCSSGVECANLKCRCIHPSGRPEPCAQLALCTNFNCIRLHPPETWSPCAQGALCDNPKCANLHPPDRIYQRHQKVSSTLSEPVYSQQHKLHLKSPSMRKRDRERKQLPILASCKEFCQRLEREKMLVVTAETGSGKSTQLPQYAAEHFGSLIVCTQPRVIAAITLARYVADEYDGTSVGESVGHRTAGDTQVFGSDIMFMTDSALIRQTYHDPNLSEVKVLIIDEAHERTLNTDIVLGIAKLLLKIRPNDFHVVIASATIDPTPFLQYFEKPSSLHLEVKGRMFNVSLIYEPPTPNDSTTDHQPIEAHVVSTVIKYMEKCTMGNVLVFLPGQSAIEKCVAAVQDVMPVGCVALPLFGAQSPEEQDRVLKFDESQGRMIVFCTNVAETSLTIPNTRLVIDSGLAKEARYDVLRRLTVIQTVCISRSSADQRKGRAGRTSNGGCVRLYNEDDLKRLNIEPEILRSSLDLTFLQLFRLNYDPRTFPFMNEPSVEVVESSLTLLTKLGCLVGKTSELTERGELFAELSFDPRLSALMVDSYKEIGGELYELAVSIAAILSAPGSIFMVDGSTKEAKDATNIRVAMGANDHESDLFYLYSVYKTWKVVGNYSTAAAACSTCNMLPRACTCRILHSAIHGLNNRLLQMIDTTCQFVFRTIAQPRWKLRAGTLSIEEKEKSDILGRRLAQLFPEQCGHLLVSKLPSAGIRLIDKNLRAGIHKTSVSMQKLQKIHELYNYFVAMTITQLPSTNYLVHNLHPVPIDTTTMIKSPVIKVMILEAVGWETHTEMRKRLNEQRSEPWAKWLVLEYDRPRGLLTIWGQPEERQALKTVIECVRKETVNHLLAKSQLLTCGSIKATFQSGLTCGNIEKPETAQRLDLQHVPNGTLDQFNMWLKRTLDVTPQDIKENSFQAKQATDNEEETINSTQSIYLVFSSEEAFKSASSKVPSYYINPQGPPSFVRMNEKETWGRQIHICTPYGITRDEVLTLFGPRLVVDCKPMILSKVRQKQQQNNSFLITAPNREVALRLYTERLPGTESWTFDGSSTVTVIRADLYPELNVLIERIRKNFEVDCIETDFGNKTKRCIFQNGSPQKTSMAAAKLAQETASIVIRLNTERQRRLFNELSEEGLLDKWAHSLNLVYEKRDPFGHIIELRGPQIQQGQFMRRIGDYSDAFDARFYVYELNATCVQFFGRQKAADGQLQELAAKWAPKDCSISYVRKTNSIIAHAKPILSGSNNETFKACKADVEKLLSEVLAADDSSDAEPQVCVFCGQTGRSLSYLRICGHTYCRCVAGVLSSSTADLPLKCSKCNINIHIYDLRAIFSCNEEELMRMCKRSLQDYLVDNTVQDGRLFCPNDQCSGLLKQSHGYQTCLSCGRNACGQCRLIDDELHENRSCTERKELKRQSDFIPELFTAAEKFVKENWPLVGKADMQPIVCIERNRYLENNCRSLERFYKAAEASFTNEKPPPELARGFFAFHGTSQMAVLPICSDGFDPSRRRAQRYGPGEYFGINAAVSHGYSEKKSLACEGTKMIIAFLLQCPQVITRDGFCHIANNPTDWSLAYNLPVLVISYGPQAASHNPPTFFNIPPSENCVKTEPSSQKTHRSLLFGVPLSELAPLQTTKAVVTTTKVDQVLSTFEQQDTVISKDASSSMNKTADNTGRSRSSIYDTVLKSSLTDHHSSASTSSTTSNDVVIATSHPTWRAPFRWYWRYKNHAFEPYNDEINKLLEVGYEQWTLHGGPSSFVTAPIIRYVDDIAQTYRIDFMQNTQTNMTTDYKRRIERRRMEQEEPTHRMTSVWYYQEDSGVWTPFESFVQKALENGDQSYRKGEGRSAIDISFPGRPEMYEVDFVTGRQINKVSKTSRAVKRETVSTI